MRKSILIVDDDTYICKLLSNFLKKHDFDTETAYTGSSALDKIRKEQFHLVLSDYRLPDRDGFDILHHAKKKDPGIPVIIMTAYKDLATAVRLIKSGAFDYLTKPLIHEELLDLIKEATVQKEVNTPHVNFQQDFIHGKSKKFKEILEHVRIVSPVNMSVIIEGETGSGKEFIARAIHYTSKRKDGPFIAVDCGALPKGIVNSELFGHVKGAFTGATYDKKGLFEQANRGTLFLDEIGNLEAEDQMKLLRVLQEKRLTRVGDTKSVKVDVRLIVATNIDMLIEMENGKIREDLYHRLNEFKITVPPLRFRGEDVLVYADAFLNRAAARFEKQVQGYDQAVRDMLLEYSWPGNIRELKNVITRAVLLSEGPQITLNEFPDEIKASQAIQKNMNSPAGGSPYDTNLKDAASSAEKEAIIQALVNTNYNKSQAARYLKIDRKTLYNKIKQYNISLQ